MERRTLLGCILGSSVALALWSCNSDTSDEHAKAKALGEGCSINSDCTEPYVCVFERCHVQCKKTLDCPAPERCVKWQDDIGVCQFDDEANCSATGLCQGKQVCAYDNKCRDFCNASDDCLAEQVCVDSVCAEPSEVVNGHLVGWDGGGGTGGGGTGGVSGSGGTGGVSGGGGTGGVSGSAGVSGGGAGGVAGADASTDASIDSSTGGNDAGTTLPIPVAYWPLDAVGGGMDDVKGNLDGEYQNLPTSDPSGKVGKAVIFNLSGTNQQSLVSHDTTLDSPVAVGVSAWIKPAITLNASAGTRVLVSRTSVMVLRYAAGKLEFQVFAGGSGSAVVSVPTTMAIGTWHHIAAGYDATNGDTLKLFLDGVEIGSTPGLGSVKTSTTALFVGSTGNGANPFVGSLDEVSLYAQALSQTQVNALFAAGNSGTSVPSCGTCPTPLAHYPLDDSPDPTVPDLAGTNPGAAQAGVVSTAGKVGTAAVFSDSGDYVEIANTLALDPVAALTIAMWVRPSVTLDLSSQAAPFFDKLQGNTGYGLFSPGAVPARFMLGGISASAPGVTFAAGVWHHVAGTWDGSNILFYIDGALAGQAVKTTAYAIYASDAWIGGNGTTLGGSLFGAADEVVLYDVALSSAQVNQLYVLGNAGTPVPH